MRSPCARQIFLSSVFLSRKRSRKLSDVITSTGGGAAATGPVRVEKFAARFVHALVSVCAEIIALCLQQIRRQNRRTILIVKRERGAERGSWNSFFCRRRDDVAPA